MAAWMLYASIVAILLGAGAWILERGVQTRGVALRFVWAMSLAASFTIPALSLLRATESPRIDPSPAALDAVPFPVVSPAQDSPLAASQQPPAELPAGASLPGWPSLPPAADRWALALWGLLSLATAAALLRSSGSLRAARRRWRSAQLDGRDVLVSDALGPAVVGVLCPAIVLPGWALALPQAQRELILRHEEEHLRAGDLRLLIGSLVAVVLFPWNAGLWWQLRRLRMAVEVDCDRRVLRTGELRRYASLLLDLGQRGPIVHSSALALTHSAPLLERRIRLMTARQSPRRAFAASLAAVAAVFALAAWRLEPPAQPVRPVSEPTKAAAEIPLAAAQDPMSIVGAGTIGDAIAMTSESSAVPAARAVPDNASSTEPAAPRTDAPEAATVQAAGTIRGRVTDRSSGAPLGSVQVYLVGDDMGTMTRASGSFEISDVPPGIYEVRAERIGLGLGVQEVTVVDGSTIEVNFELNAQAIGLGEIRSDGSEGAGPVNPRPPTRDFGPPRRPADTPSFTPFVVRPKVMNVPEVQAAMANVYTPELIAAGVTGTVEVWLYVAPDGVVENVKVNRVHAANAAFEEVLTRSALTVTPLMRFTPAMNRDQVVASWVEVPLTFVP